MVDRIDGMQNRKSRLLLLISIDLEFEMERLLPRS